MTSDNNNEERGREPNKKITAGPYTRGLKLSFTNAKNMYIENLMLPGASRLKHLENETKYARAARLGLCFKCFREDTNPDHRPRHQIFAYCPECYSEMDKGTEALISKQKLEVKQWFPDG